MVCFGLFSIKWGHFELRIFFGCFVPSGQVIHAFLRVCMIFFPTFIANFIFPTVEFSVTKLLTLIASDGIWDKL